MPQFINGPTNYVKLTGDINGFEKNIYLFMDTHYNLENQTRCESFDSIDISYYLYTKIKKAKEPLDFFMEIRSSQLDNKNISNKRDIYINEVINLFKSEFVIEKIQNKELVKYSKSNHNVRLHFLDIRDHFNLFYIIDIIKKDISYYINLFSISTSLENKNECLKRVLSNLEQIEILINKFSQHKKDVIKYDSKIYDKINNKEKYYMDKVLNKYNDSILKNNINLFINNSYKTLLLNLRFYFETIKENILEITNINEINIEEIQKNMDSIYQLIIDLYSLFTDAYLLRRVLDKNYINTSIIYTGGQHSANYIYFLVKYYNFKIIKVYNSLEKNINVMNKKILNALNVYDIYDLFLLNGKNKIQCIEYVPINDGTERIIF